MSLANKNFLSTVVNGEYLLGVVQYAIEQQFNSGGEINPLVWSNNDNASMTAEAVEEQLVLLETAIKAALEANENSPLKAALKEDNNKFALVATTVEVFVAVD